MVGDRLFVKCKLLPVAGDCELDWRADQLSQTGCNCWLKSIEYQNCYFSTVVCASLKYYTVYLLGADDFSGFCGCRCSCTDANLIENRIVYARLIQIW